MVLLRFVRPLFRNLTRTVERKLEGTGLTLPLRAVLERLYEGGPATVPAIARALSIPRQFAQKLVDEAAGLGLVERMANPAHRTSALIGLTGEGRLAVEGVLAREMEALEQVAGRFDGDDVEAATRVVADLAAAFRAMAEAEAVSSATDRAVRPTRPTGSR